MKPLLSICIPTYNRANKLLRLLRTLESEISWLKLDSPIQVLVSDNASSDETPRVIAGFSTNVFQLKYFRQSNNIGADANPKFLYEQAETEYVWLFSDDDLPLPGALVAILMGLQKHNPDALIFSFIQPPGLTYKPFNFKNNFEIFTEPRSIIDNLYYYGKISIYILRKVSFDSQQSKELESFVGSGYFFIALSYSVMEASKHPKLCVISQQLATCDEDYLKFDLNPKVFLEKYKLLYHPFVMNHAPKLAQSKINESYYMMIEGLYLAKMGALVVSDPERIETAIRNAKIRLFALLKAPKIFRHLILMKLNLIWIYKKINIVLFFPVKMIDVFFNFLKRL